MKITKTLYLFETSRGDHAVCNSNVTGAKYFEDYVLLCAQEVIFDVPDDINIVALKVAAIDRKIERTQDEFSAVLRRLKDDKAKLLCLENGVSA